MNPQALFDRHIDELARMVDDHTTWDEYAMLRASAILRSLLLDDDPLLHQVNRARRLKLFFIVRHNNALMELIFARPPQVWMAQDALSPRLMPGPGEDLALKIKDFFAYRALYVDGQDVTIKDLILHVANVEGGVHAGKPRDALGAALVDVNRRVRVGLGGGVAATMRAVADIVVATARPLTSLDLDG
jgi:hypothetical protein